ncbi:MAG: hypothetical protein ACE14P_07355 [Methanotrichaceae archaeon]
MRLTVQFITIIAITIIAITILASAELPAAYYQAMSNMRTEDTLCVKNYDAGASITESYTDFEYLNKDTEIVSRSRRNSTDNAVLEANINSEVIGNAHIAWQSVSPAINRLGRHAVLSRSSEDITGVFSIAKFLQLWSNSTIDGASIDWLPCA